MGENGGYQTDGILNLNKKDYSELSHEELSLLRRHYEQEQGKLRYEMGQKRHELQEVERRIRLIRHEYSNREAGRLS